jgi:hypothetical protein
MLAQSFLTADALAITEKEHKALIKVLGLLDCGELKHVKLVFGYHPAAWVESQQDSAFNMGSFECGTARCIGGWVRSFLKEEDENYKESYTNPANPGLYDLYFPGLIYSIYGEHRFNDITVAQAACALRSYLTTGNAQWQEALKV